MVDLPDPFAKLTGFQWDEGNSEKNWISHQVTRSECEQTFFNQALIFGNDEKHSKIEQRYYTLGQTDDGRLLFMICTIREKLIRVISARDMSKKASINTLTVKRIMESLVVAVIVIAVADTVGAKFNWGE